MPEETLKVVRTVYRFPVLNRLWRYVVAAAVYAALVVTFVGHIVVPDPYAGKSQARVSEVVLFGILFGWLMSFRTQAAYSRWWEGRMLWGQLVNDTRNLALKSAALVPELSEREKLGTLLARFAEALREHLRRQIGSTGPHSPMAVTAEIFKLQREWCDSRRIDGFAFLTLDSHVQQLMNVCGACERIRSTPLTTSYRGLLRKAITGYLVLLPWLLSDLTWWAVPITALVTYALVSLELIASGIEDPFGFDGDDLPLEDFVLTIKKSVQP